MTGPALSLLNARAADKPASMKAYTANRMTSARIVTLGQARAMIPTMRASTPRRIKELDTDLNMVMFLSIDERPRSAAASGHCESNPMEGQSLTASQHAAAIAR